MNRILIIIVSVILSLSLVSLTAYASCGSAASQSPLEFVKGCSAGTAGIDPGSTGSGEE